MNTTSSITARRPVRSRLLAALSAVALVGGFAAATGTAAHAEELPDEITVTATAGGDWVNTAFREGNVQIGIHSFKAACPASHPYLKRHKTGSYEKNENALGRSNPGGVIVHEAGPVGVSSAIDEGKLSYITGDGPSGVAKYWAVRGIQGTFSGWGGTAVEVVLHCVSDPFNGAVTLYEKSVVGGPTY